MTDFTQLTATQDPEALRLLLASDVFITTEMTVPASTTLVVGSALGPDTNDDVVAIEDAFVAGKCSGICLQAVTTGVGETASIPVLQMGKVVFANIDNPLAAWQKGETVGSIILA